MSRFLCGRTRLPEGGKIASAGPVPERADLPVSIPSEPGGNGRVSRRKGSIPGREVQGGGGSRPGGEGDWLGRL